MVKLKKEHVQWLMSQTENIRNVCVMAQNKHGRRTLVDCLISRAGILTGDVADQPSQDEYGRDICDCTRPVMKSVCLPLYHTISDFEYPYLGADNQASTSDKASEEKELLINLISTNDDTDLTSDFTENLPLTDGTLLVVDSCSGLFSQTESFIRQSLMHRNKVVLFLNKFDRAILVLKLEPENLYGALKLIIDNVNFVIETSDTKTDEQQESGRDLSQLLNPGDGNVSFGSALHMWSFTLADIAKMYSDKFRIPIHKLAKNLWGDRFYDSTTKKWSSEQNDTSQRGFCKFVLDPIYKVMEAVTQHKKEDTQKLLEKLNIRLESHEKEKEGMPLLKTIMRAWLPAAPSVLNMIYYHLPSPNSQKHKMDLMYPYHDNIIASMQMCDPEAALMMYISKIVPRTGKNQQFAIGRIFSGKIKSGEIVRVLDPLHQPGNKKTQTETKITEVCYVMGRYFEEIGAFPAGNIVALYFQQQNLLKRQCTVTTGENVDSIQMPKDHQSKFVVRSRIACFNSDDTPLLISKLKQQSFSNSAIEITIETDGGAVILSADTEQHLSTIINNNNLLLPAIIHHEFAALRETIAATFINTCTVMTTNKHNSMSGTVQRLPDALVEYFDSNAVNLSIDLLNEKYKMELPMNAQLWCVNGDANILIDVTGGHFSKDNKAAIIRAFKKINENGVLTGEPNRGLWFTITEISLDSEAVNQRSEEFEDAAFRLFSACIISSSPCILEPIFSAEVHCPQATVSQVCDLFGKKQGFVSECNQNHATGYFTVKGSIPVKDALGFEWSLSSATEKQGFFCFTFSHWEMLNGNPMEDGSISNLLLKEYRKRRKMSEKLPMADEYL